ncbi:MAG: NAD-dependent epimerase/dehydratase family protein [Myxococcales bacterium]|nr:NAD-dependent epimerase/dehydratase family protein [Myxococcota bacterium]MDW8280613.1 NAD-dependent epimerase/dehydratase family protein [Myxococcales bacterium]
MPSERVLVTGASGFLGEHLVRLLRESGQAVRAFGRHPSEALRALGVDWWPGDLMAAGQAAEAALHEALSGCTKVYHLAGLVSRDESKAQQMMRLHVDGTRRLLHAAARCGVRRVLLLSSSGTTAVSRTPTPIADESFPYAVDLCAGWPYYLSKIYQEKLALTLGPQLGLEVVAVLPSLLLGPGDRRGSSTGDVRRFLCHELPFIPPGGLSFVDVRDVALACISAMEKAPAGRRYLLGGPNWTFAEFFGRLGRIAKVEGPMLRLPARWSEAAGRLAAALEVAFRHRGHDPPLERISVEMARHFWYCDASRARAELGFAPRDPAETLDDTVRDLRPGLRRL